MKKKKQQRFIRKQRKCENLMFSLKILKLAKFVSPAVALNNIDIGLCFFIIYPRSTHTCTKVCRMSQTNFVFSWFQNDSYRWVEWRSIPVPSNVGGRKRAAHLFLSHFARNLPTFSSTWCQWEEDLREDLTKIVTLRPNRTYFSTRQRNSLARSLSHQSFLLLILNFVSFFRASGRPYMSYM